MLLEEPEEVSAHMEELYRVIGDHGYGIIEPNQNLLTGWARTAIGSDQQAIELMERGVANLEKIGIKRLSFQFYLLADAYLRKGSQDAALSIVNRALENVYATNEHRWEAEIHRVKGNILVALDEGSAQDIEQHFSRAIETAKNQEARWFELRAAVDLARYWCEHARDNEARDLLNPLYSRFTEGFDTKALREAKALLASM